MNRLPATLAAGLLSAALLASSVGPSLAARGRSSTADKPRLGYRIPKDGTAGGGWLGSRKLDGKVVYRIDPAKAPQTRRFSRQRWVSKLAGGSASVTDTRRAAWIVSKYGRYPSKVQGAAVEVALDALLHAGNYAVDGRITTRRLTQSGAKQWIDPLVSQLLDASAEKAGPYAVAVAASGVVIGDPVTVTLTVRSASGAPIRSLPVRIVLDDSAVVAETDDTGTATASVTATTFGPRRVQVLVSKVPEHRLLVRAPVRGRGSRVVIAGQKRTATGVAQIAVQARPMASVTAPGWSPVTKPVAGTLTVARGYASPRPAAVTLHGPFPSTAAACSATPIAAEVSVSVRDDAAYPVPAVRVAQIGYYRWSAKIPPDAYNLGAETCGGVVAVKAQPAVSVSSVDASLSAGQLARTKVVVRALPAAYADQAVSRVYGPFAQRSGVKCVPAKLVGRRDLAISGPSTQGQTRGIALRAKGFYGWQTVVPAAPLSLKTLTGCGAAGSLVKVS